VGEAAGTQEDEVKRTVVRPSNGQSNGKQQRSASKSKPWSVGLRRLTKKQKEKIYRVFVWVFLGVFTLSIVGGLIALTVLSPAK
jgi:hypothetical protein